MTKRMAFCTRDPEHFLRVSLSKKSLRAFLPSCFPNCKIKFCSMILQFCRCGGFLNAKGHPDGFLSHFSSLRNFRLGRFFDSLDSRVMLTQFAAAPPRSRSGGSGRSTRAQAAAESRQAPRPSRKQRQRPLSTACPFPYFAWSHLRRRIYARRTQKRTAPH